MQFTNGKTTQKWTKLNTILLTKTSERETSRRGMIRFSCKWAIVTAKFELEMGKSRPNLTIQADSQNEMAKLGCVMIV